MEFCKICQNLLYIKTDAENNLTHYCKNCKYEHQDSKEAKKAFCVSKTMYYEDELLYMQHQNEFLRHDPTLPRVQDATIKCPNGACTAPEGKTQVIYVKYHTTNMKYFYTCDFCGHTWRQKNDIR